jgi:nucleotide-binding universal stress UspA family protein
MFEKILVPLDTSILAEQALPCAAELAKAFNSEINMINICEEQKTAETGFCQLYIEEKAEELKKGSKGTAPKIKTAVMPGSPAQKIVDYVHNQNIDLIIMSSHGRSGVVLWPLGSTADKVLRRTRVPLIIVKVKETQGDNLPSVLFERILVALDGSELAARVVPFVAGIAEKLSSQVVLLRVIETERQVHNLGRIDSVPYIEYGMESEKKRAVEYLEQERQKFISPGRVTIMVKTGNVAQEIITYAKQNNCSLIALSSHTHSGLESWVIGSVTNKILHAANKSILFVPSIQN